MKNKTQFKKLNVRWSTRTWRPKVQVVSAVPTVDRANFFSPRANNTRQLKHFSVDYQSRNFWRQGL